MTWLLAITTMSAFAQQATVTGPDSFLKVNVSVKQGIPIYSVTYKDKTILEDSPLGFVANVGDFSRDMTFTGQKENKIDKTYTQDRIKQSQIHYQANELTCTFTNKEKKNINIIFRVSNNDIAFRYSFPITGTWYSIRIDREATSFNIPERSTSFVAPLSPAETGWCRATPAYEEKFSLDAPLNRRSQYGEGYAFPALFRIGNDGWMLLGETGTDSDYAGCSLSEYVPGEGYRITFPLPGQGSGLGSSACGFSLPGSTPWRTITVGSTLKPIVETTIPYDVVKPLYESSQTYKPGRYVWSWINWQDPSINCEDQKLFIDMAATMGYEYNLIDANWERDEKIGRKRMTELSSYAMSKGVRLILWYSSNGHINDTHEGPRNLMDKGYIRRREMKWLKDIGVAGIKVDYFGCDKQETMKLYEDILADANDFGIFVIFHGCTLPRGWERMYPNFISSEAVRASENVYSNDESAKSEAQELATFAFTRNAVAAMDYGGTLLNKHMSRDNKSRHARHTSDILEIAAAIFTQTEVQCIGMMPNNLEELPQFELDLLKEIPTAWDETRFIDGYPGKYFVVARRSGSNWYVAGLNAEEKELKLTLSLPMLAGKQVSYYNDSPAKNGSLPQGRMQKLKVNAKGEAKVIIRSGGGLVLK